MSRTIQYDAHEVYEVIGGARGSFVAIDVNIDEQAGMVSFHDTSHVRSVSAIKLRLRPMTVAAWNTYARQRISPQAPLFRSRVAMISALRAAVAMAH